MHIHTNGHIGGNGVFSVHFPHIFGYKSSWLAYTFIYLYEFLLSSRSLLIPTHVLYMRYIVSYYIIIAYEYYILNKFPYIN